MYSTQLSEYYGAHDLKVGALVEFNNHRFLLIDADEYAYNYMENHGNEVSRPTTTWRTIAMRWVGLQLHGEPWQWGK